MAVCAETDHADWLTVGLRIVVSDRATTTMIALDGEWDLAQRERVRQAIRRVLIRRPERVVLDLTRLTFMDSTGVHGVIELAQGVAGQWMSLVVIPGPRAVQRLFEICHVPEPITSGVA